MLQVDLGEFVINYDNDLSILAILKHHITPHTVCSVAVITNATVHNENGWILNMERLSEDEISLDGRAKFIDTNVLLTNGVIHFIDTVLIPDSGRYNRLFSCK